MSNEDYFEFCEGCRHLVDNMCQSDAIVDLYNCWEPDEEIDEDGD